MPKSTELSENQNKYRARAAFISLIVGITLCFVKMVAWYITGSSAIMSDALESFINVATALLAIVAVRVSARPADDSHPYGHGKIEFFSSGIEGAFILLAGVAIIIHSVMALLSGTTLTALDTGLIMIAGAGVANLFLGLYLINCGKKYHSETLVASGHHVLSDAWTSAGIIIGIGLVILTGVQWLDPLFALMVGAWILRSGYIILRRSLGMLMDEADPVLLNAISDAIIKERRPGWIAPHRLRAWRSGATVRIDFHLILPYYWTLEQTHDVEHAIHDVLGRHLDQPSEVIVHTEPCFTACCSICTVSECPVRKSNPDNVKKWSRALLESELAVHTGGMGHPDRLEAPHSDDNI